MLIIVYLCLFVTILYYYKKYQHRLSVSCWSKRTRCLSVDEDEVTTVKPPPTVLLEWNVIIETEPEDVFVSKPLPIVMPPPTELIVVLCSAININSKQGQVVKFWMQFIWFAFRLIVVCSIKTLVINLQSLSCDIALAQH